MKDRISTEDKLEMGLGLVIICAFILTVLYIIYSINKPDDKPEETESLPAIALDSDWWLGIANRLHGGTPLDDYQHFLERMSVDTDTIHFVGGIYDSSFLETTSTTQTQIDNK